MSKCAEQAQQQICVGNNKKILKWQTLGRNYQKSSLYEQPLHSRRYPLNFTNLRITSFNGKFLKFFFFFCPIENRYFLIFLTQI